MIVYRAANPCFGRTLAYFLLTFLFVDKRNGRDYIYLNTKEVSLSFYSNSFTMNLRQRKLFLPLPVLQVISKHSSYRFFLLKPKKVWTDRKPHSVKSWAYFGMNISFSLECEEQTNNNPKRLQSPNLRLSGNIWR